MSHVFLFLGTMFVMDVLQFLRMCRGPTSKQFLRELRFKQGCCAFEVWPFVPPVVVCISVESSTIGINEAIRATISFSSTRESVSGLSTVGDEEGL